MSSSSRDSTTSYIIIADTSNGPEQIFLCTLVSTTIKLNGDNFLLWSQYFRVLVGQKRKSGRLFDSLPNTDPTYPN